MRFWAANEALSFGSGGVRAVADALAIGRKTLVQGKRELQSPSPSPDCDVVSGRQRRPGGVRSSRCFQFGSSCSVDFLSTDAPRFSSDE